MFENLTDRLENVFKELRRRGKLSEKDVDLAMREVRLALLEADVNYSVVKDFVARVRERAVGHEVSRALNPGQQVVKIVNEELITTLGPPERLSLNWPATESGDVSRSARIGQDHRCRENRSIASLSRGTDHAGCLRPLSPRCGTATGDPGGTVECAGFL